MLKQKTYTTTPGTYEVVKPELAYLKKLHRVMRETDIYYITKTDGVSLATPPTGLGCLYTFPYGSILFDSNRPFEVGEKVNVIYEI